MYFYFFGMHSYDCNIIVSTAQIGALILGYVLGIQIITKNITKLEAQKTHNNVDSNSNGRCDNICNNMHLTAVLISSSFAVIMASCIIPFNLGIESENSYLITFWIYMFIIGGCCGVSHTNSTMIFVQLMPKDKAGKYMSVEIVSRTIFKAIFTLATGILLDISLEWLWYIVAITFASVVFLLTIVWYCLRVMNNLTQLENKFSFKL